MYPKLLETGHFKYKMNDQELRMHMNHQEKRVENLILKFANHGQKTTFSAIMLSIKIPYLGGVAKIF